MSERTCNIALPPRLLRGVTRTVRVTVVDKNDNPVDLTVARNVVVTVALDGAGRSEAYVPGISIQGDDNNVVEFAWYADVQRRCGRYTIDINADFGNRNQSRVDFHREFGVELVEHSVDVTGTPQDAMEVDDDLDLEGTLEVTTDGMSAFDQWRTSPESEGYPPTEEGFFAWMRQPATDAATAAAAQMSVIQGRADEDHTRAGQDHTRAESDHGTASSDHTRAEGDHTQAGNDHTQAGQDHTTAGTDHTRAESDHTTAGNDHTRAESDHTRAENDHTRAEQDHAAIVPIPAPTASDIGKVLTVTDTQGTIGWEEPAGGDVDQTYDPTSQNAQSGVAMAGALAGKQDTIDSTHKLPYSFISGTPTIPDAVEANPTVPSGTTPTALTGLKIGNGYYDIEAGGAGVFWAIYDTTTLAEILSAYNDGQLVVCEINGYVWQLAEVSAYAIFFAYDYAVPVLYTVRVDDDEWSEVEARYVSDFDGSYDSLSGKPTIPAAQVQTDWNASSGMGVLLNKPTLATVATSGSYTDLTNKPTIPTVVSMSAADIATAVDTAWNAVMS